MAATFNKFEFCDQSFCSYSPEDESKIIILQALVRGKQTRKQFQKLREVYAEIFAELEQPSRWELAFPRETLCLPVFQKKSKKLATSKDGRSQETKTLEPFSSISEEFSPSGQSERELAHLMESSQKEDTGDVTDISSMASEAGPTERKLSDSKRYTKHTLSTAMQEHMNTAEDKPERELGPVKILEEETSGSASDVSSFVSNDVNSKKISSQVKKVRESSSLKSDSNSELTGLKTIDPDELQKDSQMTVAGTDARDAENGDPQKDVFSETITSEPQPGITHSTPQHDLTTVSRLPHGVDLTNQKMNFSESFGDSTSVWDSVHSSEDAEIIRHASDPVKLEKLRENVSMELLWIQQAIDSRKNYLKLKNKMSTPQKTAL